MPRNLKKSHTSKPHRSKPHRSEVKRSRRERLARQLAAYSVAAGAGVLGAEQAGAAILPVELPGGAPLTVGYGETFFLDFDGDGNRDFRVENYLGLANFSEFQAVGSFNGIAVDYIGEYGGGLARVFNSGELISSLETFADEAYLDNIFGTRGLLGFLFDIPGSTPHLGFLDVGVDVDSSPQVITIFGGFYESLPNVAIAAGVPEPSGLSLLALGAAGAAGWRRKRGSSAS